MSSGRMRYAPTSGRMRYAPTRQLGEMRIFKFFILCMPIEYGHKKQRQTSQSASAYKSQHIYAETRKYKISKLLIAAHCRIPTARCMMHPR